MMETQKSEYLCPQCGEPFDPSRGIGEYGMAGTKDGVPFNKQLGVQMTCGSHSWQLPGKTMMDVMKDFPVLAPEYIRMTIADQALRGAGL